MACQGKADENKERDTENVPSRFGAPGVAISHERAAPDTEPHVIAPLILALPDGRRLIARKWSLAGIRDSVLSGEDLTGARLTIPFQGIEVGFPVRFAPSADGTFWAFEGLTGRQREALGLFYRNLMTGKMAATDEVITALDTPVDLVPMGETEEEKAAGLAKVRPRSFRIVINLLWYVGLAIFVVGVLGSLVWNKVEGITLSHARVYAERFELLSPGEGFVQIAIPPDQAVAEGSPLARLHAPETDLSLEDAQDRVAGLQSRIEEGRARLELHDSMKSDVRASVARLYSKAALSRFDAGISIRPGDHNDLRSRLEQELRGYEADLDRATAELRRLQQLQRFIRVTAPKAGYVVEWLAKDQQFVRSGDVVGTFETDAPRVIRGWMDDRMATSVGLGMEAEITIQMAGEPSVLAGRVVQVEAGENPAAPDQFGTIVTIAVNNISVDETRALLRFNAPIDVVVKRNLARRWFWAGE